MTTCGKWKNGEMWGEKNIPYQCTPATPCRACLIAEVGRLRATLEREEKYCDELHRRFPEFERTAKEEAGKGRLQVLAKPPVQPFDPDQKIDADAPSHILIQGVWLDAEEVRKVAIPAGQVLVDARELEALREGFGILRTAWNMKFIESDNLDDRVGPLLERFDAFRFTTGVG